MHQQEKGFINAVILVVLALIILGYFNINIAEILDLPMVKNNLMYLWNLAVTGISQGIDYISNWINQVISSQ
jgi:hypothetical protein